MPKTFARPLFGSSRGTYAVYFLIVLAAIVFIRAFWSAYVIWDDDKMILSNFNLQLPFWEAWEVFWTKPWQADYLPIPLLTFWADYQLWGFNPVPQHILNWGLHLANIYLVYLFLSELGISFGVALFAVAAFAVHPLQVESVMWVSERKGLLSTLFLMIAMIAYVRALRAKGPTIGYVIYPIAFVVSGLCKMNAIFLPFVLAGLELIGFRQKNFRLVLARNIPVLGATALLCLIRYYTYAAIVSGVNEGAHSFQYLIHVPIYALTAIGHYVFTFFWPGNLSVIYPQYPLTIASQLKFATGFCFVASWFYLGYWKKSREILYGGLWFLVILLPVLQIVPRINFVNDRYMYLPMIGFAVCVAEFLRPTWSMIIGTEGGRKALMATTVTLVLVWAAVSNHRAEIWESNYNLWADTVTRYPRSQLAWNNLGLAQMERKQIKEAESSFLQGSNGDVVSAITFMNLAMLYTDPQQFPDLYKPQAALNALEIGLRIAPSEDEKFGIRFDMGIALSQLHRNPEAIATLNRLLADIHASPNEWIYKDIQQRATQVLAQIGAS
jgi:hypothetical protein